MDEDVFDQMLEALHQSGTPETPAQTNTRWQPDGTYNKKPLDPNITIQPWNLLERTVYPVSFREGGGV